jgi:hypothetical protein
MRLRSFPKRFDPVQKPQNTPETADELPPRLDESEELPKGSMKVDLTQLTSPKETP